MKSIKFPSIKKKLSLKKSEEKDPFLEQLASSVNSTPEPAQSGNEGVSYADLIQQYNELQAEYIQNPTVETNEKLIELNKKMQDSTITDNDTGSETFVDDDSVATENQDDQEDNEQPDVEIKDNQKENYIAAQIEKHQPFVSQKRRDWRNKKPELETTALEKFQQLQDILVQQKPKEKQNKILEKNFGRFIKKDEPKLDEPKDVPKEKPETKVNDAEKTQPISDKQPEADRQEPVDEPKEETITAPSDLNPQIKEIWPDLDNESKRRIIEKHKLEKETEQELKKKSIFNKKINFSLKKKEIKETEDIGKKKFSLFNRKPSLKNIEAYCHKCKHELISHTHKGKSAGCKECGCLVTIQKILEVNKITFKTDDDPEEIDNGLVCKCGHNEIIHKLRGFCEEKDCYCVGFQKPST